MGVTNLKTDRDIQAFSALYKPVHAELEKYCRALFRNSEDALDLMGDTALIAFESFSKLNDRSRFKHFLFGIAVRQFKKRLRDKKQFSTLSEAENLPQSHSHPDSSADLRHLYAALERLPENEREIIALFELSGFSLKDIAGLKQMNLNTVKTHLSRGRERLCSLLNPLRETIH